MTCWTSSKDDDAMATTTGTASKGSGKKVQDADDDAMATSMGSASKGSGKRGQDEQMTTGMNPDLPNVLN